MSIKKALGCSAAVATLACAVNAHAVGVTVDRMAPTAAQQAALNLERQMVSPGISFGSPVGFGLNWGQVAFGVGGQTQPRSAPNSLDGSAGIAVGMGDSRNSVGLEVTGNIISLTDNFGDAGSFNAKLHRQIGDRTAVSIGAENFNGWGAAHGARVSSYAAVTTVVRGPMGMPVVLNGGVGDDRFRSSLPTNKVGGFASVAFIPTNRVSFILDYTGVDLNAAVSMVPFKRMPIALTVGMVNLTERQNLTREVSAGIGYLLRF